VLTRTRQALIVAIVLTAVSTVGGRAFAADEAEQLIKKGLELRKRGDDLGALPLFEKAYRSSHTPRAAAQLGFCEQALGRWTAVETHMAEVLKTPDDPWVKKNRAAIDESLLAAKARVAVIEIHGEPAGGQVFVNAAPVGQLPLARPLRVEAGEIDVELRAAGYRLAIKSVRVEGGQYQKIVVRAEPEFVPAAPARVPAVSVAGASQVGAAPGAALGATTSVTTRSGEGSSDWRATTKWVSWGLGAAALGVGVYGFLKNKSLVRDFDRGCAIDPTGEVYATATDRNARDCRELKSDYEAAGTVGAVGLVGAGIFSVTGVILYIAEPSRSGVQTAWTCAPGLGPQNRYTVGCSLRF
jgi:hypothetical protein